MIYKNPIKNATVIVKDIMNGFASRTGLNSTSGEPSRYLWTDAFAVCNFLQLYQTTGDSIWLNQAFTLVDQTHLTLGQFRKDNNRRGWLSQLDNEQAVKHPTLGGLRIGKKIKERKANEPANESLEWDRDGQYFHYLTQWMHALQCVSAVTKQKYHLIWALELAQVAHKAFVYAVNHGEKRMYWKMSIDLTHPLVHSMGQHDPLDGLVTYMQLDHNEKQFESTEKYINLSKEIEDFAQMCRHITWRTHDPLGIGSLLIMAHRLTRLIECDCVVDQKILEQITVAAKVSLDLLKNQGYFDASYEYRLPFREFGLSIGLQALDLMSQSLSSDQQKFSSQESLMKTINQLKQHIPLVEKIHTFWLREKHQNMQSWQDHLDINSVMLATSLMPNSYLKL